MVDNLSALTQVAYADVTSDFWRLSCPRQFICRFPEKIEHGLVWKTGGKKYF
jgi:hypothetical protein